MEHNKEIVKVNLGARSYNIVIGQDILKELPFYLNQSGSYGKIFIITDQNVAKLHLPTLQEALRPLKAEAIILPAGEATKDFSNLEELCERLLAENISRNTLLIAFGGGVIGDICGFAASILLRGINFIQIPTTLLAAVDSSIGGKTAINSKRGKNLIGSFYQPKLVFCNLNFMSTLSNREFLAGYAEVVKYGLIRDQEFFDYLNSKQEKIKQRDSALLKTMISTSCRLKAEIVSVDEKEQNLRALLNFGHTFGHVLETETSYSDELLHGEAVAIGMALAAQMSVQAGMLSKEEEKKIISHLQNMGLPTSPLQIRKEWQLNNLITHLYKDKKIAGSGADRPTLTFILLQKIGQALITKDVTEQAFIQVMQAHLKTNNP